MFLLQVIALRPDARELAVMRPEVLAERKGVVITLAARASLLPVTT